MDVDVRPLHDLLLSRISAPEQMLVHDPKTRRDVSHDYLLFERFHSGGGLGEVADVGFSAHPSRLHLVDMSRRYVSLKGASRSEGVLIPHALVAYDPSVDPAVASIDLVSGRGRLLASAHQLLTRSSVQADAEETSELVAVFVSLVERFMLGRQTTAARERAEASLPLVLRNYIRTHLADPGLGPEKLCAAFGVSRAALYRHFEDEGGVGRYLRNRRLDRCFYELAGLPPARGRVSRVAHRWGFHDPTRFNRLFRERFGMPPSACCADDNGGAAMTPPRILFTIQTWLRQLPQG